MKAGRSCNRAAREVAAGAPTRIGDEKAQGKKYNEDEPRKRIPLRHGGNLRPRAGSRCAVLPPLPCL